MADLKDLLFSREIIEDSELKEKLKQVDEAELAKIINDAVGTDVRNLNTFIELTQNFRAKQDQLDIMAADTLPSAILTAYLSDILEPNNNGDLVSIQAKDRGDQVLLDTIYQQLNLPEDKIVYSLLKNGIVICEFARATVSSAFTEKSATEDFNSAAQEEVKVQINYGKLLPEVTIIQDTTRIFPIVQRERCIGFIEVTKEDVLNNFNALTDVLDYKDVIIHSATDFAYVKFGLNKYSKSLQLKVRNKKGEVQTFEIDVGCSLLENSFSAWKTLSVLEDSVVLASLIKNATTIVIQTEIGSASDTQIEEAKIKLKGLFEGKLSMGEDGLKSYLAPRSKPNYVYSFTTNGVGTISSEVIGGEYNPGQLYYLNPFIDQFFGGMNVPKQMFGFTEDSGGLNGGGAVEEYTKRYTSTVSMFKRLLAKFIKTCINNVLRSRGLTNVINNFDVKIYKAYKEEDQSIIQMQQQSLQVMEELIQFLEIENPKALRNLKMSMVKKVFSDKMLLESIEDAMLEDEVPDIVEDVESPIAKEEDAEFQEDASDEKSDLVEEIEGSSTEISDGVENETAEDDDTLPPLLGSDLPEE